MQLNQYLSRTPAAAANTVCTQTKENSCCSVEFEKKLVEIVNNFYQLYASQKFFLGNILKAFGEKLLALSTQPSKFIMPESLTKGELFENLKTYRMVVLKLIKAHIRFLRGNLCVLCAPPAAYSQFIIQLGEAKKIILNQDNFTSYLTEVSDLLQQLATLKANLITSLTAYKESYDQVQNKVLANYALGVVTNFINSLEFCPGQSCTNYASLRVGLFHPTLLNELRDIISPTASQMTQPTILRNLEVITTNDYYELSAGGLATYITDSTDIKLTYEGVTEYVQPSSGLIKEAMLSALLLLFWLAVSLSELDY